MPSARKQGEGGQDPAHGRSRRSIAGDLTVAVITLAALVCALAMALGYLISQRHDWRLLTLKAEEYSDYLHSSLETPLWNMDEATVIKLADSILSNDLFVSLIVVDSQGRVIFDKTTPDKYKTVEKAISITHGDAVIGMVHFGLTARRYVEERQTMLWNALLMAVAVLVALATLTGLMVRFLLRRPLRDFQGRLEGMAGGDYAQIMDPPKFVELEGIARKFNDMAGRIRARQDSLEAANQRLQGEIAERRRAEEALRVSEERYRSLFDNISDFIYTHDLQGRFLTLNRQAAQGLGYEPEELLGRSISDLMQPRFQERFFSQYLEAIQREESLEGTVQFLAKDGGQRHIEVRNRLVREPGREPYVSGSGRDVTARVLAERELQALQEELAQSRKMEAVGTLASGIAHDFNNILQVISGAVQLGQERAPADPEMRGYLADIARAVERASDLVRRLLAFSRKDGVRLRPLDLGLEVRQTVKILERTLPKMIAIETRMAPDLRLVRGDPAQLEQVLLNLAGNAKDAMPLGGRLLLEAENMRPDERFWQSHQDLPPGDYVLLRVSDNGRGMERDIQQRIFEPFFTTKELGAGTGLGLSTVYGIVSAHGGAVTCQSQPGRGTVFEIFLPALEEGARPAAPPAEAPAAGLTGSETILVVDDEESIVRAVSGFLGQLGYRVIAAASGEEALARCQEAGNRLGLVVLDLGMPGMGGLGFLGRLRAQGSSVKVIVASGYLPQRRESELLQDGVAHFIHKPYRLLDLARRVREVLDSPPAASPA